MKLRVLSIGYGRHSFDVANFEHHRLDLCAKAIDSLDHVIFSHKKDNLTTVTTSNDFTLHPTNSRHKLLMINDAIAIGSSLIVEKHIDIVSTQDPFEAGLVGWILKIKHPHIKLQVQEHGDVLSSEHWRKEKVSNRLRYWFAMRLLQRADVIRVVSERTKKFLQNKIGTDKEIRKLPVVIDTASFRADFTNRSNGKNSTFTFITAARFVSQKNFPLMLQAFARAYKAQPHIRLRIFGNGPLKLNIKKQINQLGISRAVSMQNWTDDLAGEMLQADAYLLTSNYEGWARVLIEAMLQHLPIVTTDVGCVGEVVVGEEHALVVPVDDIESLSLAIQRLASDQDLYNKLQQNLRGINYNDLPGTDLDEYAQLWIQTMH